MKRAAAILTGIFFLLVFIIIPAQALEVSTARIVSGSVRIIGHQAEKGADIFWEGELAGKANPGGAFKFETTNLPSDCVGTLGDGINTIGVVIDGCTMVEQAGGVLQTGQTQCDDGLSGLAICPGNPTGQDGELRKGTARSYTDNGQTITDNGTGLEWEKLTDDGSINDKDNVYTWTQAFQKVAELNAAQFAGQSDWRLPNVNELLTLLDYGQTLPAIDPVFKDDLSKSFTQPSFYWSSTSYINVPSAAWSVFFSVGFANTLGKANTFHVRAVRGAP